MAHLNALEVTDEVLNLLGHLWPDRPGRRHEREGDVDQEPRSAIGSKDDPDDARTLKSLTLSSWPRFPSEPAARSADTSS